MYLQEERERKTPTRDALTNETCDYLQKFCQGGTIAGRLLQKYWQIITEKYRWINPQIIVNFILVAATLNVHL